MPTASLRLPYGFFVIEHGRRHIVHFNATFHPTSAWVIQQLREAFPYDTAPRYLIFDRDFIGASAIKCCYAAAGSGTGAEETGLRALLSTKTSIRDHKGIVVAKKMSRKVSRRVVRPACIAGVRISRPNFRAPCGRTKL